MGVESASGRSGTIPRIPWCLVAANAGSLSAPSSRSRRRHDAGNRFLAAHRLPGTGCAGCRRGSRRSDRENPAHLEVGVLPSAGCSKPRSGGRCRCRRPALPRLPARLRCLQRAHDRATRHGATAGRPCRSPRRWLRLRLAVCHLPGARVRAVIRGAPRRSRGAARYTRLAALIYIAVFPTEAFLIDRPYSSRPVEDVRFR